MSDIFISYSKSDREFAKKLATALEREGWSVWWDRKIPVGKSFDQVIQENLDVSKCVIVLWSNDSVTSDWVKDEAAEGLARKILAPVFICSVPIPIGFRRVQTADLIGWQGDAADERFQNLLQDVKGIVAGFQPEIHVPRNQVELDVEKKAASTSLPPEMTQKENEKSLQSDPIEDESSKISSPTTLLDEMEVQTTHANSSLKSNTPPQNTTEVSKNSIQAGRVEEEESNESYQSAMPLNKEVEAKHSEPISLKNNGQKLNVPRRFLGKALIAIAVVFTAIVFFKGLTYYVDDLKQKDLKRSRMANRDLNSAACKDLDLDLSIGTLNGLKPSDDPAKIVAKLPCWLTDATAPGFYTEKASAGGKITYSSFIFYTCQDFLEVKKSFSGKVKFGVLDQPLLFVETVFGTNYEKITRQESRYECIYSMEYGALGVQFFNSRVELIRIYGRNYKDYKYDPVSSANKCD